MLGLTTVLYNRILSATFAAIIIVTAVCFMRSDLRGQTRIEGPTDRDPIAVVADFSREWKDEDGRDVAALRGRCQIVQGDATLRAQKMVVWRTSDDGFNRLVVYLEDDVQLERPGRTLSQSSLFIHLVTRAGVTFEVRQRLARDSGAVDALFRRAAYRRNVVQKGFLTQTQLVRPPDSSTQAEWRSLQVQSSSDQLRRIRISPRSAVPYHFKSEMSTTTTPPEQISILTGGVNLLIDGGDQLETVDLTADNIVIWTEPVNAEEFKDKGETLQSGEASFQVYLEGNIFVRQGQNVTRASHAFYDAREDRALLRNAEIKAYIPALKGNLRIRADQIRQLSQKSFHAQRAWITTSKFGKPGYRLQASDVFLEHRYANPWLGSHPGTIDPMTGALIVEEIPWVTTLNNTFLINDFPLMFAPHLSGPAEDPNIPLRKLTVEHDHIFGGQVKTTWNIFKLLGRDAPQGVDWNLQLDYLTDKGPAIGTSSEYQGADLLGIPGTYSGKALGYYIHDDGTDNLGQDRRNLVPKKTDRRRALLRFRNNLPDNLTLFSEIGFISDRNFLEQYYEREFDEGKDNETLLYLKQQSDVWAWTLLVRPQINDFSNTTEWYPRGDSYVLSQPLFGGLVTWSTHTSVGLGKLRPGDAPSDPADVFTPLPFIANVGGGVLMSRHELNLPLNVGPIHLVPYLLGEGAFWSEGLNGNDVDRFIGSTGVRSSIMFWKVFPHVCSRIFNLNGLAHKMIFEADYSLIDSTQSLANIAQYNEFDDNAQERFRERFPINTFGGVVPTVYEPRFYAVRNGTGSSVTAPYYELIDDQQVFRLRWRQRLQTKVGPPERLRIKDWMTLDLEASYFPDPTRDNFGEPFGLLGGRYRWYIGDRTSLLADAYYDLFDDAPQLWNAGVVSQRGTRGSVYAGLRQVKGTGINSSILTASCSYAMSSKWISTLGTAYDLGEHRNRGQSLTITRVGADFLIHVGANLDASKGNTGIAVSIEPRFGPFDASSTQLSSLLGTQ